MQLVTSNMAGVSAWLMQCWCPHYAFNLSQRGGDWHVLLFSSFSCVRAITQTSTSATWTSCTPANKAKGMVCYCSSNISPWDWFLLFSENILHVHLKTTQTQKSLPWVCRHSLLSAPLRLQMCETAWSRPHSSPLVEQMNAARCMLFIIHIPASAPSCDSAEQTFPAFPVYF